MTACSKSQGASSDNGGSSCTDDCSVGGRVCSSSTAYRICGNFDSDSCLEYGLATACSSGQTCTSGLCSGTACLSAGSACTSSVQCCSQSCQTSQSCESKSCKGIISQSACISKNGCQWYSNFFIRECRGTYQVCTTTGPKCTGESSTQGLSCTDECTAGSSICSDSSGYSVCGNFDSDSCLEYGPPTGCPSGQTCSNGQCSSGSSCLSSGSTCSSNSQCCSQTCQTSESCDTKSCNAIISQSSCIAKDGCSWYSNLYTQECRGTYQVCASTGPKCQ
ncbi:MAG: hypothetical protein HYX24_05160 [Candidatus Aenigmarchaeota archaeon]|nr:hypothetical protein [Candidatus Aenigmarchaeota archaeon]